MRARVSGALLAPRYRPRVLEYWYVPSDSTPGVEYLVTRLADGSYTCDCPDWRIRRAPLGEDCKHIGYVQAGRAGSGKEQK